MNYLYMENNTYLYCTPSSKPLATSLVAIMYVACSFLNPSAASKKSWSCGNLDFIDSM